MNLFNSFLSLVLKEIKHCFSLLQDEIVVNWTFFLLDIAKELKLLFSLANLA